MTSRIYDIIEKRNWKRETKNGVFLACWMIISAIMGMLVWVAVGRLFLEKLVWMFVFMGYAIFFIGFVGGVMFLYTKSSAGIRK